jgi:enolase-phosphatase E1
MSITAIICDIEGTTTSISFVKDILFPHAYENCEKFLDDHYDEPEIQEILTDLANLEGSHIVKSDDKIVNIKNFTKLIQTLIAEDKKVKPLKQLQGKIWKQAFESHAIKGHVYEDVARNFQKWTESGIKIFIYSSGSVEAQKLLFGHSQDGDLTKYLSGYFDTNVGHKQEQASYENILREIKVDAGRVLFLSDIYGEVEAASEAGINCIILVRPGNYALTSAEQEKFTQTPNFDSIQF